MGISDRLKKNGHATRAFVLVKIEPSRDHEFLDAICRHEEVLEGHLITGDFDAFVIIECESTEAVHEFVLREMRSIREVIATNTFISTDIELERPLA